MGWSTMLPFESEEEGREADVALREALQKRKKAAVDEALARAGEMIGTSNFPQLCADAVAAWDTICEQEPDRRAVLKNVFFRRTPLFFVDPGRGWHTALRAFSDILKAAEAVPADSRTAEYSIAPEKTESWDDYTIRSILSVKPTLLVLDLTDMQGEVEKMPFKQMLKRISDMAAEANVLLLLRFPYMNGDRREQLCHSLEWTISARPVVFEPFSDEDIIRLSEHFQKRLHCELDEGGRAAFLRRVCDARDCGEFYGARTVEQIVSEAVCDVLKKQRLQAEGTTLLSAADSYGGSVFPEKERIDYADAMEELRRMVGMEEVTAQVEKTIGAILAAKNRGEGAPSAHMSLTGNPGTGKTTVARVIARTLKDCGVLKSGKLIECTSADLIGEHVGHTAPKTRKVCKNAYGSVLFIDEAYMLSGGQGDNDFGKEALAELVAQIENHRDDMVVIISGYQKEMEEMLNVNPGMKRRFPHHIHIPNCTPEQLTAIYMRFLRASKQRAEAKGFTTEWDDAFEAHVRSFFGSISKAVRDNRLFGNGGYARNLQEETLAQALARVNRGKPVSKMDFNLSVTEEDFDRAAAQIKQI